MKRYVLLLLIFTSCDIHSDYMVEPDNECGIMELSAPNMANYDYRTGFIEGDILPDKGFFEKGFIINDKDRIWKDGIIPYYYKPEVRENGMVILGFDSKEQAFIDNALNEFSKQTPLQYIKFESREALLKEFKDGVMIEPGFGKSYAHLGRQGGIQTLGISAFFVDDTPENLKETHANILHEGDHTAGAQHEFNRPDRDESLIVHWENIPDYLQRQFYKADGIVYGKLDMKSIMMYGSENGAKEGTYSITTTAGESFERNYELSKCDCYALNSLYPDEAPL